MDVSRVIGHLTALGVVSQVDLSAGQKASWKGAAEEGWKNFKASYILSLPKGALVKDPSAGGNIYSEGTGFGMLLAAQMNDQATFDMLLSGAENYLKVSSPADDNYGLYSWLAKASGASVQIIDKNSASDADQDIAQSLIWAQKLVDSGKWKPPKQGKNYYNEKALELLGLIWEKEVEKVDHNSDGKTDLYILKPSASRWLGRDSKGAITVNPSYLSPAWYNDFAAVDKRHDWLGLRDSSYKVFNAIIATTGNFIPDWCEILIDKSGRITVQKETDHAAANIQVFEQRNDGIRAFLRLSQDAVWNKEERAINILKKLTAGQSPSNVKVKDASGNAWHNELAVAMYTAAAVSAGSASQANQFISEFQKFHPKGKGYFGTGDWDGARNQYYNQTLCIFASLLISGEFKNIAGQK